VAAYELLQNEHFTVLIDTAQRLARVIRSAVPF
jgi:hypothetical protein